MILDSDEDQPSAEPTFEDKPEFEDEDEEIDPLCPYPPVVQYLDLVLGIDVLQVAVPPVPSSTYEEASKHGPPILHENIVFAAACADHSIRVISLPLMPPSPASKARAELQKDFTAGDAGKSKWGETVLVLGGHQAVPNAVSITFVPVNDEDLAERRTRSKSQNRTNTTDEWSLLIASHSPEITGLLLIHHINITSILLPTEAVEAFETQFLSSPATSLTFNPCMTTASRSTHLLITDSSSAVRIYSPPATGAGTPASPATLGPQPTGSFLLTIHPPFTTNSSASALPQRKTLLSATYIQAGRAIFVLHSDSSWGIYDVEGVAPGAAKSILGRQGIKGGSITPFSVSGWIEGAAVPIKSGSKLARMNDGSKFAPMTPATRKNVEPGLFSRASTLGETVRGGVAISRSWSGDVGAVDESLAFWVGESYAMVPNVWQYWEVMIRRGNGSGGGTLFSKGGKGGRLVRLNGVNLKGEMCNGIEPITRLVDGKSAGVDVVVVGKHRYVVYMEEDNSEGRRERTGLDLALGRSMTDEPEGHLDVMDIDEALTRMEDTNGSKQRGRLGF
jgi:hypothetical protein